MPRGLILDFYARHNVECHDATGGRCPIKQSFSRGHLPRRLRLARNEERRGKSSAPNSGTLTACRTSTLTTWLIIRLGSRLRPGECGSADNCIERFLPNSLYKFRLPESV